MGSNRILLIGGGGHCRSVLDTLLTLGIYDEIGIIERDAPGGQEFVMGLPVVGTDLSLPRLFQLGWNNAFVTIGSIGDTSVRRHLYNSLCEVGFHIPVAIDPTAVVSSSAKLETGAFIGKRAVINANSHVGLCAIINTGAIIEHDCTVGDFSHISSGCTLCGEVAVGEDTHIGAASVIRQQVVIGRNTLVGAGSVVVKNLPENIEAYGNPAVVVKQR